MKPNSIFWFVWWIPVVFVLVATSRVPYGYYTLTKLVVCSASLLLACAKWGDGYLHRIWPVLFGLIAVLYNPIVSIHLNKGGWFYLDLATAAVFIANFLFVRFESQRPIPKSTGAHLPPTNSH